MFRINPKVLGVRLGSISRPQGRKCNRKSVVKAWTRPYHCSLRCQAYFLVDLPSYSVYRRESALSVIFAALPYSGICLLTSFFLCFSRFGIVGTLLVLVERRKRWIIRLGLIGMDRVRSWDGEFSIAWLGWPAAERGFELAHHLNHLNILLKDELA